MFTFILLDVVLVALLKVLGQDNVPVLPDGVHARLLTDGVDVSSRYSVRSGHVVLQVNLVTQVHLGGDRGEDQSLLSPVWERKLNLSVKSSWSQ